MNETPASTSISTISGPATPRDEGPGTGWYITGVLFAVLSIFIFVVLVQSRRYNSPRAPRRIRRAF